MPYKDAEKRKEFKKEQMRARRKAGKAATIPVPAATNGDKGDSTPPPARHPAELIPDKEISETERFWWMCGIDNVWLRYEGKEGFNCCKGLGLCALPYVTNDNESVRQCFYHIKYCIYFRRAAA